jgi:hypothetical protein
VLDRRKYAFGRKANTLEALAKPVAPERAEIGANSRRRWAVWIEADLLVLQASGR